MAPTTDRPSRVWRFLLSVALLVVAVLAGVVVLLFGAVFLLAPLGSLESASPLALAFAVGAVLALAEFGFLVTAVGFVLFTGRGLGYFDLGLPDRRDLRLGTAALLVLLGLFAVGSLAPVDVTGPTRELPADAAALLDRAGPLLAVSLAVVSLAVIGPCEELFFRNVLQKYLADAFSEVGAVLAASVVFVGAHALQLPATPGGAALSLSVLFCASLVLGTLYAWTDSVVLPAVVHGLYDVVVVTAGVLSI